MNKVNLIEITLKIDSIIIGERIKGGVFRPCLNTIPSSTIEGALKHYFGVNIPAVGLFLENTYSYNEFTYTIKDKFLKISKMPIITSYLSPKNNNEKIQAKIYLPNKNHISKDLLLNSEFQMGALKSKGFGKSLISEMNEIVSDIKQGILGVKIFYNEIDEFNIEIISPNLDYLFKPDVFSIGGIYKKALLPGSIVKAPEVFLKEVTYYDE